MDVKQLFVGILVFFISIAYLVIFIWIQIKLQKKLSKNTKVFREKAKRDGRVVTAHLKKSAYHIEQDDVRGTYSGKYTYIAPNGKEYKMKTRDCINFIDTPPDTMTLYLDEKNYRKYYIDGYFNTGKHGGDVIIFLLSLFIAFAIYIFLMSRIILPILN